MGYTLTIGEAALSYHPEWLSLTIEAKGASVPEAPNHDPFTGTCSSRSPSYTAWSEFCRDAGIYELFYGQGWDRDERRYLECTEGYHREEPIIANHPGYAVLCEGDFKVVKEARERRQATNGGKPPGFWEDDGIDNGKDPTLARLMWLEFWIRWALDNCKIPILANS